MLCKRVSVRATAKPQPDGLPPRAHSSQLAWPWLRKASTASQTAVRADPGQGLHCPPCEPWTLPHLGGGQLSKAVSHPFPSQGHTHRTPLLSPLRRSGPSGAERAAASWGQEARTALSTSLPAGAPNTGQDGMREMRSPAAQDVPELCGQRRTASCLKPQAPA